MKGLKVFRTKKLFIIGLVIAVMISVCLPASFELKAAGATEYKASDYAGGSLTAQGDSVLILDKDVTINDIQVMKGALTIKNKAGENHTLSVGSIYVSQNSGDSKSCNLIIESGTINVTKSGIEIEHDMVIGSAATLNVNVTEACGNLPGNVYCGINCHMGSLTTSGNVKITSERGYAVNLGYDLTVNGGTFSVDGSTCLSAADVHINDGNVSMKADGNGCIEVNSIYVNGGKAYVEGAATPIIEVYRDLIITGGYIEVKTDFAGGWPWFVCEAGHKISIGDNMEVAFYDSESKDANGNPIYVQKPYRLVDGNELMKIYGKFGEYNTYVIDKGNNYIIQEDCSEVTPKRVIIKAKPVEKKDSGSSGGSTGGSNGSTGSGTGTGSGSANTKKYSSEWVNGKWYNADGSQTYQGTLEWKCNSTGWWVEDTSGWYPVSQWQKIDGKWYYFLDSGYMDYSEYRDGYWLGSDGALVDGYFGEWKSDSTGWWFEDKSGWYPQSQYLWINGSCYYFESDGYWDGATY